MDLLSIASRIAFRPPEAPPWAPFGQYAWASRREGTPEEPDNALEESVHEDLRKHFASSRTGLSAVTANLLSVLMVLGWYQPVLHPPPNETLYRGVKLRSRSAVAAMLGIPEESVGESGSVDFDSLAVPVLNGFSTSWSARKGITKDFSERGKAGYAVTLIADVAPNRFRFLAGPGGLYDVDGLSRWHLEKETVGLEPVAVRRAEWRRL